MPKRIALSLLIMLHLVTACSAPQADTPASPVEPAPVTSSPQEPEPPTVALKPLTKRAWTVAVPETWVVTDETVSGDQVILADPAIPGVYLSVFTFADPSANWESMKARWQFENRSPEPIVSPMGRSGLIAQGPLSTDPSKTILAAGYFEPGRWVMIAQATAANARFDGNKPLFEAILKTFQPLAFGGDPNK